MRTLILNGSPRPHGDTAALLRILMQELRGECTVIDCCTLSASPCTDCRRCRTASACAIQDGMLSVYRELTRCDNLILASPVHYAELSSGLLRIASRFQVYSSALIFRHEQIPLAVQRGAVLLTQGGSGGADRAYETARLIFRSIGVQDVAPPVCSARTDVIPAAEDAPAIGAVRALAHQLNRFAAE